MQKRVLPRNERTTPAGARPVVKSVKEGGLKKPSAATMFRILFGRGEKIFAHGPEPSRKPSDRPANIGREILIYRARPSRKPLGQPASLGEKRITHGPEPHRKPLDRPANLGRKIYVDSTEPSRRPLNRPVNLGEKRIAHGPEQHRRPVDRPVNFGGEIYVYRSESYRKPLDRLSNLSREEFLQLLRKRIKKRKKGVLSARTQKPPRQKVIMPRSERKKVFRASERKARWREKKGVM